ncbi:hypothetical protein [Streptomyces sp. ADI98-10]|uniref:restriction endonuclease subunit S n=1 Tax=Streptomyces sp. ADI98-10 TaxID=1522763 RepID=UPI000F556A3F|nr:hypothetical protein [Streptomyces sp. ADI98-10]RPK88703.1 EcoKI restriction-modification system protein HsdS [Streptomyces sp. ADI98-10]
MTITVPLRRLTRMAYGEALASDVRVSGNFHVVSSGGITGSHDARNFRAPGIVIGRKGSYGSVHWIPNGGFAIDTAYYIDERLTSVDLRWLYYVLQAIDLRGPSQDVGVPGLARDAAYETHAPLPPPAEEQYRIANFLDAETAHIEQMENSRSRQISALDERELAVIADMLSGGATPDNGKPTGWRWLPHIPANWKIGPVYAYYLTELGKMLNSDRASGRRQRPYLRNANVHWYEIDSSDMATMHFSPEETRRYSVQAGDLLVCEGGAGVAEAAVWDGRIEECFFQKSIHRVRQNGDVPVEWLMYWLRFAKSCGVFEADGNIATIPHLTGEQLREYRIPIPDDAQFRLTKTIEALTAMKKARARLKEAQGLLAERRQALITAAVSGQFDVSTASGRNVTDGVPTP